MNVQSGKIKQERVLTAIVGSYPKPAYLYAQSGRQLLDDVGFTFYDLEEKVGTAEFQQLLDRAAAEAIEDQNTAGIDLITDGEERRGHYVLYVLRGLAGIDFTRLTEKSIRDGRYTRQLPTVVGRLEWKRPILLEDYRFTAQRASGIAKIGLPGPSTVVDSVADAYYGGDREQMALDYAEAIRQEVASLVAAGCRVIQFDDPALLRYPEQAKAWGLEALQACFRGYEEDITTIVHICRGYPDKPLEAKGIAYKADANYYGQVLSWLSDSTIDIVSIEGEQSKLDLSVLPAIGSKTIMLGVLDVGENGIERVEYLVARGREALRYLPREQLILAPDCGMLQLSRQAARQKLANMAAAAQILNQEKSDFRPGSYDFGATMICIEEIGIDLTRQGGFTQLQQLEQELDNFQRLGFRLLEINTSPFSLIVNDKLRPKQLQNFTAVLHNFDLRYSIHGLDRLNLAYDPRRDLCQRIMQSQIEICRAVGASRLVYHSGLQALSRVRHGMRDTLLTDEELAEGAQQEVEILKRLAPLAADAGVTICVENGAPQRWEENLLARFDLPVSALARYNASLLVEPIVRQLEAVNHPNVAMTLDVGHLFLAANLLEFDYLEAIETAAPWVKHLHVNDNFGHLDHGVETIPDRMIYGEGDIHLPPGWGRIPYHDVFARLPAYKGDLILEIRPLFRDYAADALQTMRQILDTLE